MSQSQEKMYRSWQKECLGKNNSKLAKVGSNDFIKEISFSKVKIYKS